MKKTITILLVSLSLSLFGQSLSKVDSLLNAAQEQTEELKINNDTGLGLKIGVGASLLALLVIVGFDKELYKQYIEKFYNDTQFNSIYKNWIDGGKDKYMKPSLDHIIPKTKNGSCIDLNNLQFLTWFENRCKNNMNQGEWNKMKKEINKYFT